MTPEPMRLCLVVTWRTAWNAEQRLTGPTSALEPGRTAQATQVRSYSHWPKRRRPAATCSVPHVDAQPIAQAPGPPSRARRPARTKLWPLRKVASAGEVASRHPEDMPCANATRITCCPTAKACASDQHASRIASTAWPATPRQTAVVVTHGGVLDLVYLPRHGHPARKNRATSRSRIPRVLADDGRRRLENRTMGRHRASRRTRRHSGHRGFLGNTMDQRFQAPV